MPARTKADHHLGLSEPHGCQRPLPEGLTLTDNGDGTAALAGTPTAGTSGVTVSITATNVAGSGSQNLTIIVNTAPLFTSASVVTLDRDVAGSFSVTTSGLPVPEVSTDDTLPEGLTLIDNGDGTATLAGTTTDRGR